MKNKASLLVIDDDIVFCQLVKRGLEAHGFLVGMAHDESAALSRAKEQHPDFILLDLRLGDSSGLQMVKPLLAIRPDTHIIVLTGYSSLTTAVQAIKLGAINYLAKPIDIPAVLKAIADSGDIEITPESDLSKAIPTSLKRLEWEHLQRILNDNDGNISATARQLNMHRRTLQRKLQKKPMS